jgi:hypothetical protein
MAQSESSTQFDSGKLLENIVYITHAANMQQITPQGIHTETETTAFEFTCPYEIGDCVRTIVDFARTLFDAGFSEPQKEMTEELARSYTERFLRSIQGKVGQDNTVHFTEIETALYENPIIRTGKPPVNVLRTRGYIISTGNELKDRGDQRG